MPNATNRVAAAVNATSVAGLLMMLVTCSPE